MGAIVFATDVEWLQKNKSKKFGGGKFLIVEGSENLETEGGGYAKVVSDDFKKTRKFIKRNIKKN